MSADSELKNSVTTYYKNNKRDLPWRQVTNTQQFAYYVYISEMMLQQTQVGRVVEKFNLWVTLFPDINSVARASLVQVLEAWNGLGYNRRARYVHEAAKRIQQLHAGNIPDTVQDLVTLPGVGHNTAAAILVYAYNQPHVFIETNIRTVYLYHYFKNDSNVSDKEILEKVQTTVDTKNPREWYWALMDYGTYLKKQGLVSLSKSKTYKKQAKFIGSNRQLRGKIIAVLLTGPKLYSEIYAQVDNDDRLPGVMNTLIAEGLIEKNGNLYGIANT